MVFPGYFKLSSLPVFFILPRLRPRTWHHIRLRCGAGSTHTNQLACSPYSQSTPHPATITNAADFYRTQPVADRRIHVLGVGSVGRFLAHSLRGIPNPPPITLLFGKPDQLRAWNESALQLTLETEGNTEVREGFDAELAIPRLRHHGREVGSPSEPLPGESTTPISSLLVCCKAHQVLQGLSAVRHRLHAGSVVCFLQNGMGIVQEVDREIFPDPATRPHYMLAVNSHGIHIDDNHPFTATHAGFGTLSLGLLPHQRNRDPDAPYIPQTRFRPNDPTPLSPQVDYINPAYQLPTSASFPWTPIERYLLRILLRTPLLSATAFSPPDLLQMQLDKLAVNCIINPLTTMIDARNGAILNNFALTRTLRLLLAEISLVIRSLPELQYVPNVAQRFDPGRLETVVVSVAHKTSNNISSMLADMRAGRQTEIDYINGWIVKRGEELGIRCLMNYMMMQMVEGKQMVVQREIGERVPLVGTGELHLSRGVARKNK